MYLRARGADKNTTELILHLKYISVSTFYRSMITKVAQNIKPNHHNLEAFFVEQYQ